jgi:hypothetical protein
MAAVFVFFFFFVFVLVFFFLAAPGTGPLFFLPLKMTPISSVHNTCAFGRRPRLFLLKYCDITVLLPFFASSTLFRGFWGGASLLVLNCNRELESRSGFEFLIVVERDVQTCLISSVSNQRQYRLSHVSRDV